MIYDDDDDEATVPQPQSLPEYLTDLGERLWDTPGPHVDQGDAERMKDLGPKMKDLMDFLEGVHKPRHIQEILEEFHNLNR